jgi:predicted dehydrogenase
MAGPVRYGMAGGGEGAFIGRVHRMAAALDGEWTLVAGTFSADPVRNQRSGAALGLSQSRVYNTIDMMLAAERALPDDQCMQVLVIVTPNHLHRPMAVKALNGGFAVISDKPMALSLSDAHLIADAAATSSAAYGVTYTYAGYPLVEEARAQIASGVFGTVRRVDVEYRQGWLSTAIEVQGQKQAAWRTDPAQSGEGGAIGDIGTHAFHLAEHVSGLRTTALCADLATHIAGRRVDDDASMLLRFENGARGTLVASQICAGEENGLVLRVVCEGATLIWRQCEPNSLEVHSGTVAVKVLRTGGPEASPGALARTRTPAGHPEGYIEAFANLYRGFAHAVRTGSKISPPPGDPLWFPSISDGLRGMAFVDAALTSSRGEARWTHIKDNWE